MDQINTEILRQFESQGLTINEGIAIDARLVKSASRPISNYQIKEFRFTDIAKNKLDAWYRQAAFNISRGLKS